MMMTVFVLFLVKKETCATGSLQEAQRKALRPASSRTPVNQRESNARSRREAGCQTSLFCDGGKWR